VTESLRLKDDVFLMVLVISGGHYHFMDVSVMFDGHWSWLLVGGPCLQVCAFFFFVCFCFQALYVFALTPYRTTLRL
jgi:hypothetical protein